MGSLSYCGFMMVNLAICCHKSQYGMGKDMALLCAVGPLAHSAEYLMNMTAAYLSSAGAGKLVARTVCGQFWGRIKMGSAAGMGVLRVGGSR